ncbi:MAG: TetR/AcrR family transcriptional regulator [Actinomycetota bacterium]
MPTPETAPSPDAAAAEHTRGHKKRARTRLALVDAGLRALAVKGEALTISDVVAEAGVSNGTFYNYFDDRDALFEALARHLAEAETDRADLEIGVEDPAERFAAVTARVLARAATDHTWGRVVLRLAAIQYAPTESPMRHLRHDLAAGHAAGRFAVGDAPAMVDLVGGAIMVAIRRIVAGGGSDAYVVELIAGLLCALGVERDDADRAARAGLAEAGHRFDPTT